MKITFRNYLKWRYIKSNDSKIEWDAIIYAIYCAIIPLNMALNFTGFTINKYIGIFAGVCICFNLLVKRKLRFYKQIFIIIIFFIWAFLTSFWSIQQNITLSQLITLSSLIGLCIVGSIRDFNDREILLIKNMVVAVSTILIFYLAPNQDISYSRGTITTSAGVADQNSLAANIVFALLIAIDLFISSEKYKKIIYAICIILMMTSLLLIASRGAILSFILSIFIYFIISKKNKIINLKFIILFILFILIILFFIKQDNSVLLERLSLKNIIEDNGSGRTYIWRGVYDLLISDILHNIFGFGYGTEGIVCQYALGSYVGIHNTFLEYWATTGIIGLFLLISLFISLFWTAKRRDDNLAIALLISAITTCLFLGFLGNKGIWNLIMLTIIGCKNKENTGSSK